MLNIFKKILDFNNRELTKYQKTVEEINTLEDKARKLKDADLKKETTKLKEDLKSGKKELFEIRPWAFALVREAARRSIGQRHFDVQLIAGLALSEGKIGEQKTGEGKTLSATTALYLHALTGRGVHLVTVNDYLARRDAGWMGQVFDMLGLTTSAIISDHSYVYDSKHKESDVTDIRLLHLKPATRRDAYLADITYGVNSEFGFDYLRDNRVMQEIEMVQRGHYFAIVDEADSVLIDEARTPHIISAPVDQDISKYYVYAQIVEKLDSTTDFVIDEKEHTASLTDAGISKVEKLMGVTNLYERDFETLYHIEAALKAQTLYKRDKQYIVRNNEVIIVDDFTGRLLEGRRFSEGIHQAIEAKERVAIQQESQTLATISLQNYFRKYEKLSGMTGTASTEAEEFHKIYKADVIVVPTHRPMNRKDLPDHIYKTERAKFTAVVEEVATLYKTGRPVLIGTTSIEKNELLSTLLRKKGVPHNVLNAKNHEREAQIIAEAGRVGAVTVATNMAGRGVDIILGGDPSHEEKDTKSKSKNNWEEEHKKVLELGGLYIIGTERHESRRIDNQLRGRAGRQGDPGETRFFVSLEDDLMRIFGGEQIAKIMTFLQLPEDQPLTHSMVTRAIEQAQVKVEGYNFDIRKNVVEYDDVLNKQRDIIYDLRKNFVEQSGDKKILKDKILEVSREVMETYINQMQLPDMDRNEELLGKLIQEIPLIVPVNTKELQDLVLKQNFEKVREYLNTAFEKNFNQKEKSFGQDMWYGAVCALFLSTVDMFFTQHLTSIEDLRQGIGLRRHGQLDPLVQYKNEAFSLFEQLLHTIYHEGIRRIMNVQIDVNPVQVQEKREKVVYSDSAQSVLSNKSQKSTQTKSKSVPPNKKKLGRNDPCWCGSGKKYKKCHYPN